MPLTCFQSNSPPGHPPGNGQRDLSRMTLTLLHVPSAPSVAPVLMSGPRSHLSTSVLSTLPLHSKSTRIQSLPFPDTACSFTVMCALATRETHKLLANPQLFPITLSFVTPQPRGWNSGNGVSGRNGRGYYGQTWPMKYKAESAGSVWERSAFFYPLRTQM